MSKKRYKSNKKCLPNKKCDIGNKKCDRSNKKCLSNKNCYRSNKKCDRSNKNVTEVTKHVFGTNSMAVYGRVWPCMAV